MKNAMLGVAKQYAAGASGALAVFIVGNWMGWTSPSVRKFLDNEVRFNITHADVSWIVALMDLGNVVSPVPSGYLSDTLGRKTTLLTTAFLFLTTWLLAVFGDSAFYLFIARFGAGLGKGVSFTIVPMYLGEIAGVKARGTISTIFTGLNGFGLLLEFCIGPFLSYETLNLVSSVFPIIFFISFFKLPESPYFLLMKNRQEEAKRSLSWLRHARPTDDWLQEELDQMTKTVDREMATKGGWTDLVRPPGTRRALLIVLFLAAFQRFGGISSFLVYTVVTLPESGGFVDKEYFMIVFAVVLIATNCLGAPLMDRWGRKPMLIFSNSACAALTGVFAVFHWLSGDDNDLPGLNWVPFVSFVTFGFAFGSGASNIPYTFIGEMFPTNIKSHASSVAAIVFAAASFSVNKLYLWIKTEFGVHYIFIFYTVCNITTVIFTAIFVFETKGKTFAEIQDMLNKRMPQQDPVVDYHQLIVPSDFVHKRKE